MGLSRPIRTRVLATSLRPCLVACQDGGGVARHDVYQGECEYGDNQEHWEHRQDALGYILFQRLLREYACIRTPLRASDYQGYQGYKH